MRRSISWLALVLGACSATHPVEDAGPPELECPALLTAEEGAACAPDGLVCREPRGALCAPHEARCVDGRVTHAERWTRDGGAPTCPAATSSVEVHPGGARLDGVVAALEDGFSTRLTLYFTPGPFTECAHPRLTLHLGPNADRRYLGALEAEGQLDLGDETVSIAGVVEVSEHDEERHHYVGRVSVEGAGHAIAGSFAVTACDDLFSIRL